MMVERTGGMLLLVLIACVTQAASQLSCETAKMALRRSGLVVDLPGCAIAEKVAQECKSCRTVSVPSPLAPATFAIISCEASWNVMILVLCARWEIDQTNPEPYPEADPSSSASDYQRHFSQKVRTVALGDVPSLHQASLDFLLIKHFQVESPVDQQAEISSLVGMTWGLVRPGGVIGILSNKGQTIVLIDPDGAMYLAYADYPATIQQAAQETGLGSVSAITCPWDASVSEQAVLAVRPPEGVASKASPAELLSKHISKLYVVESAERRHRGRLEELLFRTWGLPRDMVTFQTPCVGVHRSVGAETGNCLATTARIADQGEACHTSSLLLSLQDIIDEARPASMIMDDSYMPAQDLPDVIQELMSSLEPDWGVLCASKPEQCDSDGTSLPTSRHMLPAGLSFGAALWSLRAARALISTMDARCSPVDHEVERQLAVHNISVSSAVSSFALPHGGTQVSGQVGSSAASEPQQTAPESSQAGARGGGKAGGRPASPLDGTPCRLFSFFDCHAEHAWDDCVAKRDECEGKP